MLERIEQIREEGRAAIGRASDAAAVEEVRVRFLGRKAELTTILRGIAELPARAARSGRQDRQRGPPRARGPDRRGEGPPRAGRARRPARRRGDRRDPAGDAAGPPGHLHPLTRTRREIEDIFVGLGYRVIEGPEVEHDYYNFTALNYPPGHPARMLQDTFYVDAGSLGPDPALVGSDGEPLTVPPGPRDVLLRTHTSPMQVRGMEEQEPPIFIVVPGRVYRRDSDATHTPMFHQVEGLAVGEDITLADLHGTLLTFARAVFGPDREVRIRPHFFPFTEPSVEVDVSCFRCGGTGRFEDDRCNLCKGTGWLEILGAGMVDPNVFGFVREHGYDPDRVQGFAFGIGIERIAMLKHGVPDLRMFFDNDVRMLEQFR